MAAPPLGFQPRRRGQKTELIFLMNHGSDFVMPAQADDREESVILNSFQDLDSTTKLFHGKMV